MSYLPRILVFVSLLINACAPDYDDSDFVGTDNEVRIMTLNPGHFHAALIHKNMIDQLDPTIHIYAPEGPDLDMHLERIEGFNARDENPTDWETNVYAGPDYLEKMLGEQPGNVMVTAGNNRQKTEYIYRAVDESINVLSDKPMAIDKEGWQLLVDAFESAEERDVLLYDIMTERHEVTSAVKRELAHNTELFGELIEGSYDNPAIELESVHHLYKEVAGETLQRPPWYFDVDQQGAGIVDVSTHLVDLSMWLAFPEQAIYYREDIELLDADRWATPVSREGFETITRESQFPDYLQEDVENDTLYYFSNGEIHYELSGHHTNVTVKWDFEAPPGGGDTHLLKMRGTLSDLVVREDREQDFQSTLYVEPDEEADTWAIESALEDAINDLQDDYPGITYTDSPYGFEIVIPDEFYLGHEAHFGKVAESYFEYLVDGELPHWEVPNMITKYYIITQAREMALDSEAI